MKIILAGIEYVGTTTIAQLLQQWKKEVMGEPFYMDLVHDHSKLPHTSGHPDDTTLEEQSQILRLSPKLKEMYHRYGMYYHVHHYVQQDDLTVGFHIEESIYARMFYEYGLPGDQFDREKVFEQVERRIKQVTQDPVIIVHMKAEPEIIQSRMERLSSTPAHSNSLVTPGNIPQLLAEYERLAHKSTLGPVVQVDTSTDGPEDTLLNLVNLLEPHFTAKDRERIESHSSYT